MKTSMQILALALGITTLVACDLLTSNEKPSAGIPDSTSSITLPQEKEKTADSDDSLKSSPVDSSKIIKETSEAK